MAISVSERNQGRTWGVTSDSRSATRVFDVIAPTAGEAETAPGIPRRGHPHPANVYMTANSIQVQQQGSVGDYWIINVSYSTSQIGGSTNIPLNPLEIPPIWAWSISTEAKEVDVDRNGNPIVNSVYEAPDPPVIGTIRTLRAAVDRNVQTFSVSQMLQYVNAVNNDTWRPAGMRGESVAQGQARCVGIYPADMYDAQTPYVKVTYQFEFERKGFGIRFLDQGYRKEVGKDETGPNGEEPIQVGSRYYMELDATRPHRLNGKGGLFGTSTGTSAPSGATVDSTSFATFLIYKDHDEISFTALGL